MTLILNVGTGMVVGTKLTTSL